MMGRFTASFPGRVEIIHSRLTERERFIAWHRIKAGDADLVIGPRSALFSPIDNLGLIIVDEEHESSYKQENPEPRYQARDSAIRYASIIGCRLLLGSATPSIESMHNAKIGKYELVRLKGRMEGVGLPRFELMDMVEARKQGLDAGHLSRELGEAILDRVDKSEGVILFQNKRGYSNIQECVNCGNVNMCPHCSISLTLHYGPAMLRCHICGYSEISLGKECKECGEEKVELMGSGTQLLEEEIRKWLADEGRKARVERLDSDTTTRRGSHEKILREFSDGDIDILVGTQMIAKGIDIGRITLVGVVNADMQLYIPDFRGSERLFQLLVQVGGRAGRRAGKQGLVYVQTYNPRETAIQTAIKADYESFYESEIQQREDAGLPPFRRLSKIELSHSDRAVVGDEAYKLSTALEPIAGLVYYSIPITPSVEKVSDKFRRVIIVKSSKDNDKSGKKVRRSIKEGLEKVGGGLKSSIKIDIDTWASL
jgi:primosomal protein N' (replication factor Y)